MSLIFWFLSNSDDRYSGYIASFTPISVTPFQPQRLTTWQPLDPYQKPLNQPQCGDRPLNQLQYISNTTRGNNVLLICPCNLDLIGYQISHIVRKPDFSLCKNIGPDQLCSNCEADQRLCFRYMDSTIPLLSKSEFLSF